MTASSATTSSATTSSATIERPITDVATYLRDQRLFAVDEHGIVRLPMLIGGRLVGPAEITADDVLATLAGADYAQTDHVQIVRHARMNPQTLREDGRHLLFVLPRVRDVE